MINNINLKLSIINNIINNLIINLNKGYDMFYSRNVSLDVFDLVDSVYEVELDIYNFLKRIQDENNNKRVCDKQDTS